MRPQLQASPMTLYARLHDVDMAANQLRRRRAASVLAACWRCGMDALEGRCGCRWWLTTLYTGAVPHWAPSRPPYSPPVVALAPPMGGDALGHLLDHADDATLSTEKDRAGLLHAPLNRWEAGFSPGARVAVENDPSLT